MKTNRKITVTLPDELLEKAMDATGEGLTSTLRQGLELVVTQSAYEKILKSRGKYSKGIGLNLSQSRRERDIKST